MMRLGTISCVAVAAVAISQDAAAEDAAAAPRFGKTRQLVISDDQPLGAFGLVAAISGGPVPPTSTSTASVQFATVSDNGGSGVSFFVAPAFDYFVTNGLSLGANIDFGILNLAHQNGSAGVTDTIFGIAPRLGYNVDLSDSVSFWPKVYFAYANISASNNGASSNATVIGAFAPFLFHLVPHFFIGIGPNLSTQLSNNTTQRNISVSQPKVTQIGIQATLGGWLLGD